MFEISYLIIIMYLLRIKILIPQYTNKIKMIKYLRTFSQLDQFLPQSNTIINTWRLHSEILKNI